MTTQRSIDPQRLAVALREKFGPGLDGKRALLKKLGFDEKRIDEMLRPPLAMDARGNRFGRDQEMGPNGSAPTENAAAQLRVAIEEVLAGCEGGAGAGDVQQILRLLERHAPLGAGDEEADRSVMRNGEVDRGAEAAELKRRERMPEQALDAEKFAEFLRGKGVDEETIKSAVDMLPKSALETGLPGGKFAEKRAAGALDAARLATKFPGIEKVDVMTAADRAIDRRREPAAPSAARLRAMFERFPGMRDIGVHGGS